MANRWGNNENSDRLFFGGGPSKITADGDCSYEIKRCLLLGRKGMTNLDSILKSRDITLPTKVRLVKAMVFPVVMYGCESWTIKKADGEGNGNPLQYSCLENPMDGGAWWATVHGVAKNWIGLSDFTFTFTFNPQLRRLSTLVFAIDCFLEFSKTCDHIFF